MQDQMNGTAVADDIETKAAEAERQAAPAALPTECCSNCYFARLDFSGGRGTLQCRAKAPIAFVIPGARGGIGTMGAFPPTQNHLWCGEWKPKGGPNAKAG